MRKFSIYEAKQRVLRLEQKARSTKGNTDKLGFVRIKTSTLQKTVKSMISQVTDWEKIFSNFILDQELVSRIYKELLKLNSKKTTYLEMGKRDKLFISMRRICRGQINSGNDVQLYYLFGKCKLKPQ